MEETQPSDDRLTMRASGESTGDQALQKNQQEKKRDDSPASNTRSKKKVKFDKIEIDDSDVTSTEGDEKDKGTRIEDDIDDDEFIVDDDDSRIDDDFINYYKSFKLQVDELTKEYPRFKKNQRYEKFIWDKLSRDEIRMEAEGKRWNINSFDNYILERSSCINAVSEEMSLYLLEMRQDKCNTDFMNAEEELSKLTAELVDAAEKRIPEKERIALCAKYDKARRGVLKLAQVKPHKNSNISVIKSLREIDPSDYQKELKSAMMIWMDTQRNGGFNTLPTERARRRPGVLGKKKLSSAEQVKDISRGRQRDGCTIFRCRTS